MVKTDENQPEPAMEGPRGAFVAHVEANMNTAYGVRDENFRP